MTRKHLTRLAAGVVVVALIATVSLLAACASGKKTIDNLTALMKGRTATIQTYKVDGTPLDRIHGKSVDIHRDDTFDSVNTDGTTNADSSVLAISIGKSNMTHVGSTLVMVEDGVVDVTSQLPATVDLNNTERGRPILNYLRQQFSNFWKGKARTIMVRSQNGSPIAIFAGNEVEYFATDVPKSTLLRIDQKYVLIYRSDYSMYDNALLQ